MIMSMFLERLAAIVFGVMSVGSSGRRLPHLFIAKWELCGVLVVVLW